MFSAFSSRHSCLESRQSKLQKPLGLNCGPSPCPVGTLRKVASPWGRHGAPGGTMGITHCGPATPEPTGCGIYPPALPQARNYNSQTTAGTLAACVAAGPQTTFLISPGTGLSSPFPASLSWPDLLSV